MATLWIALVFLLVGYLINIFYITVLYHRGLTHRAVVMSPRLEKFLFATGIWVTGIDPKTWACMHRLHHLHSDTPEDPHSPLHYGLLGVMRGQIRSYERVLKGLMAEDRALLAVVPDIHFDVHAVNRKQFWYAPYLLQILIAVGVGLAFSSSLIGLAYYLGMMSHPVQGWLVNAVAHSYGSRNFASSDNSKNNWIVSLLVFGEGYQNNHHTRPQSANFAMKSGEIDLGYGMCLLAEKLGWIQIPEGVTWPEKDYAQAT